MAFIVKSNVTVSNLRVGPLSGGGGSGGGGGSSEPSYLVSGVPIFNSLTGKAYVYDATNYSSSPTLLTAPDASTYDRYGFTTTASSTLIAVASPFKSQGAVYVYDATNLSSAPTKLTGESANDNFGRAMTLTDNYLVVGAEERNSSKGAVYVYDATNLSTPPTKLEPSGLDAGDRFGTAIAVTSNSLIVGANGDDDQASQAGAIYVYDINNLSASPTKLTSYDAASNDEFGLSVAAGGGKIVVGAEWDDDNGSASGAVYVYDENNLSSAPTKLTPSDGASSDKFGTSVAVSDDYIVVGASEDDTGQGSAYVYDVSNLSSAPTKITATTRTNYDRFGSSVSIVGSQIAVGASEDDPNGNNSGAIYLFDTNDLTATPTLIVPSDVGANEQFGYSLALG
jgi:hypothetical protein